MKREDVDTFEKLVGQLTGVYEEVALLSKKSPSDAVNLFKLKLINSILSQANQFLGDKYSPFADFTDFDTDSMPQNSDVVFILSQYLQCFEKYRADNVTYKQHNWHWVVDSGAGVQTVRPKGLR